MSNLIEIDHKEYGLEETKAADISKMFKPMLDKMEALEVEFNGINKMDVNEATCKKAKELRLKYVKVRTGTAKVHKEMKAFFLQGGRFVDGWKNAQLMASQGVEKKLSSIEKHYENIEKERIEALHVTRAEELEQYNPAVVPPNLGVMDDTVWNSFLIGTKASYEANLEAVRVEAERVEAARIEAKKQAEIKRLDDIKKEKERKKLEAENAKLKKVADQKEKERLEELRLSLVAKAEAETKAYNLLVAENVKREKLEAELKAIEEKEDKARIEKEITERKAAAAPDKEKVLAFCESIKALDFPTMTTDHGTFMMNQVKVLLNKVNTYIIDSSEKF